MIKYVIYRCDMHNIKYTLILFIIIELWNKYLILLIFNILLVCFIFIILYI
jgi:hypothetical protein